LSKTLQKKLQALLRAFDVPENPLATRTNCDMLDKLRRDAVALLSLHNVISKKEKEIAALRQQLKVTSDQIVLPLSVLTTREQETLVPEAAVAPSAPATAAAAPGVPPAGATAPPAAATAPAAAASAVPAPGVAATGAQPSAQTPAAPVSVFVAPTCRYGLGACN
jgi:hypothetical protein